MMLGWEVGQCWPDNKKISSCTKLILLFAAIGVSTDSITLNFSQTKFIVISVWIWKICIVKALARQKWKIDEGVTAKERSTQMMSLVILSVYMEILSVRAKEIRITEKLKEKKEEILWYSKEMAM